MDANRVVELAVRYLPQEWKQVKQGPVTWNTGNSQQPPLEWLQEFWKFLNTHFKELSKLTGMPLIPVSPLSVGQPVSLERLQQKTTLIFQKTKQMKLPEQIAQLVNKLGGTTVNGNEWLKHEDLDSYVLSPSRKSVMKVLANLDSQHLIKELKTSSHKARKDLKDYLSHLDSLSASEKDLLSRLPLFQTMKGSCVAAQSKQAILQISGQTIPADLPMPDSLVLCATEADRRLLQQLNVKLLDTSDAANLLVDHIIGGAYRNEETKKIMTWILQNGATLFPQNPALKNKCKDLRFIEANGELKETSRFFDPTVKKFKVIFESHFFPPPLYTQTQQMRESLVDLGLLNKESDMSPEHVLHAATMVDRLQVSSPEKALKRAQVLQKILDSADLLSKCSNIELQQLKSLKWVPCEKVGNGKSQKSCFFCPDEMRHSTYENIVGHVMPLVGRFSDRVTTKLGLKRPPPPDKVLENLSVLASKAQTIANPDMDIDFKKRLRSIYEHMQDHISDFASVVTKETPWLWNRSKFVSPQELVLEYPPNLDLSAYIGKVPAEFQPYKKLLKEFGPRTTLSDDEIIGILHSIHQSIEERGESFANSSEIKVSVEIVNWLWREKKRVDDDIPVPVLVEGDRYTLKPKSAAVFCDVSKNGLNELNYGQEEIHIVHEEIRRATAEWLNIRFLSTYILDPELIGIEQCGQSEPITTRIKNILKEYDEESDIFKELIQNAEDAGAKACKFLMDFREHRDPPESLIDPDMTLCQGPCLWAFNDAQFTNEDWTNIVRVGAASKENKVEKIGKFGLGFNTVYHLTDVPSILSGNGLLILDPNVSHLKKHIKHKTNPGIKLNLSLQRVFNCFPGQFGPYERVFDCSFRKSHPEPYSGTLIKLPFRTEEEARISEISTKVYHKQNITTFQQDFAENSQTHLLFLKNINTLSLQRMSKDATTPPRDDEMEAILTLSKTIVRTMKNSDATSVSKQHEAEKALMELDGKCKEVIDSSTVSVVQITSEKAGVTEVQSWLLHNCFGTNQSLKMALQGNNKVRFSLPIGGVAVPLQIDPKTGKLTSLQTDLVGQAFSFLPLSIHTGLPVNVNGTFAVTSNRKSLWDSGVKHEWNKALLQDPVVTAYVTVLLELKKMYENKQLEDYWFYTFWPDREKVSETFKPLVDAFYSIIASSINLQLLSDGQDWCSMNEAIFLHESIQENKGVNTLAMQVCKEYAKAPNHVISLPLWLRNSFKKAGLGHVLESRTWKWEKFYQEAVFNNLDSLDPKSRDTLVLHAIDLNNKEIDSLLLRYPCIPTKSGNLQYINKLVNPTGRVACLFEPEEDRVLGGTKSDFNSPKRIQRLLELGMASEQLPLEDITEKTSTIARTWSTDKNKAYTHLKCLLDLMKNHMGDKGSHHWKTLRKTQFLPAFCPGDTKMKRKVTLRKPTDVFIDRCSLLVNMTHPILDHATLKIHDTDPVLNILGVHDSPSPEIVLQQLQETHDQSKSIDKAMLPRIAGECYRFLDQWLYDSGDSSVISQKANSFPFILVGSVFVNVSHVAEDGQFEAKPYLYVLPPAFTSFRTLWETVGVKKSFTIHQFQTVLQELRSKHGNKPLPESDLQICLDILNKGIYNPKEKTMGDCLIPNQHGVLQPASELFFNDSAWMPVATDITLCHEKIPRVVARHFGIKTTRHQTLQSHVVENISPFAFHFEQHEQLTRRIKNIIAAYPAKKDILKELLQNADDAEATEIHFVWDKRRHGTKKTFGKKWNKLQGPALCVFNNKVFSDADLIGIQQLGEGGKQQSVGKTGKYGIGFNSVYHLTDCPSILTGDDLLCISDPNQKYIESHSDKAPAGIGYNLANDFKSMYMDVYKTFLPDKFPLKEGTMFRLPLRIGAMTDDSKISKDEITDLDMEELCSVLSEDPEGLILFLKNICKIAIHEINDSSQKLNTIFMVDKNLLQTSRENQDASVALQHHALQSAKLVTPHSTIYETVISTSDKRQSKWLIAEQSGSLKASHGKELTLSNKLPEAAIAARVSCKSPKYLGPVDFIGGAFCSLPLPGKSGLPVHVNGNFEVDSARRGLWKEDGQSIKSNWNESLKQSIIAPLYADLLHHMSCNIPAKKFPLSGIESLLKDSYLCFWPTVSPDVEQEWHEMIHEVYRSIKERDLSVIPVLRSSIRQIANQKRKEYSFDWCNVSETESTKAPHLTQSGCDQINPILEDLGMNLVPASVEMQKVWSGFKSAGVKVKCVTPSTVQAFLKERPLNDPAQTDKGLPLPISATLIRDEERCSELLSFCLSKFGKGLKKITEDNANLLNGLPLLLTKDKVLRVFDSKSPKLISLYESLFCGYEEQFADYRTNEAQITVLQDFNLVESVTVPYAEKYLRPIIHQHLQTCEVDPQSGLHAPSELMLKWLGLLWRFLTSQIHSTTSGKDQGLTIKDVKQLFNDCCILPVVCPRLKNKHLLQTMKEMPSVIQFASEKDISGILFKLGFMKLDTAFFSEMPNRHTHSLLHPELMDVNDKTLVLDQIYNIKHSEFSKLSSEEMSELQRFLQEGVSKASQDNRELQRKLRSLPLFETVQGTRESIGESKEVFVLHSLHSGTYPELFNLANSNNVFLKSNEENRSLAKILNFDILTDLDYFMRFILPVVYTLTETQLLQCLRLLLSPLSHFDYFEHRDKIISSLKTVKLIRSSQGRLEMASYYFDKRVELYKTMLPQERFVPDHVWTELRKEFDTVPMGYGPEQLLNELGMKHKVSEDEIVHFAYQVESEAKGNCQLEELKQKSSLLFKTALKMVSREQNKDTKLLLKIADIKFIFPEKVLQNLCNYHQPFADERTPVTIRESLIESDGGHQYLIWTSMPIIHLPVYKSPRLSNMMKNAGAHEKPPLHCVTKNMSNICRQPCESDQLIETRAKVFQSSYVFLGENDFNSQSLAHLPVVLVEKDTKLVTTDDVCLDLCHHSDFRPYLFTIPEDYMKFMDFFKKVGVRKKPTALQYCNVLEAIHTDSCDKVQLQGNLLKTVKRAVHQLFLLIKYEKQSHFDNVKTLYLPAVDGKLYPSCTLYYNDTAFETQRLEGALQNKFLLLEKLRQCHLGDNRYEHHRLLKMLPENLQPKMLTKFTEEKFMDSDLELCELKADCDFRGWFDKHLSLQAFRHGLICLIRAQSQGEVTHDDAAEICATIFGRIQIVCCQNLETMLWLEGQPLQQTAQETDVFVKREQQGCIFYLKHHNETSHKVINNINMTLTKEIDRLFDHKIAHAHHTVLGQLLTCDDMGDVQKALAKGGIHDTMETESAMSPPAPGTEIPEEWHDVLDMSFLNHFEKEEFVGYQVDGKYIYALIIEALPENSGSPSQRYKIDIGKDEEIEVSRLDLYQFKRQKKSKDGGASAETSCMELELVAGAGPHSHQSSSTSSASTRSTPTSLDEAKREIDGCLEAIWTLPREEKMKAIKRLYLRWHPDKNPDCPHLATEAFKYLQNRIDDLNNGKTKSSGRASGSSSGSGKAGGSSNSWGNWNFSDFYEEWNEEARHHRRGRERCYRRQQNFYDPNENIPKPNREEAQRWFRQARCDLSAAYKDADGDSTEWCLFKVHQAVEKALIAAGYQTNGKHLGNKSISAMATEVSSSSAKLRDLPKLVSELKSLQVDPKKTQYPSYHPMPRIPNDQFTTGNQWSVLETASKLLSKVEAYVN